MADRESAPNKQEAQRTGEQLVGPLAVARQFSDYGEDTLRILDGNGQLKIGGIGTEYHDAVEAIVAAANQGLEQDQSQ